MAFTVDKQLLEILACPAQDHGSLEKGTRADPGADVLTCTECGRQYPVRDGIPVLLLDESHQPGDAAPPAEGPPETSHEPRGDGV